MNFPDAIKSGFLKAVTIEGRSSRSEFWWWTLFTVLVNIATGTTDGLLFPPAVAGEPGIQPISLLVGLIFLIPNICISARRLHDVGRSGWWMCIVLTVIGIIPYIYWLVKKSDDGPNKYGVEPAASL